MGRTFIRQDVQIRKSDAYTDNVAPSQTNYETNAVNIEDDLNSLRSQVHNLLSVQGSHWYNDITTPTTFENGAKRGVDSLNQDLHDLQRKRVLVSITNLSSLTVPSGASATGTLTLTGNVTAGDTVTTGTKTYTFTSPLGSADGDVLVGATTQDSIDNLVAAINLAAGSGTTYAAATTANGYVSAASGVGAMNVTALVGGTVGNVIATTKTESGAVMSWGAATLSGGAGDINILTAPQLPSNTTAAIGSVTTQGTVAAYNSTFGVWTLALVTGDNAVNPKNLCMLEDASTHDPILSSGRVVYGLFQTESNTDGSTMTGTTPNRAQLSYVRINTGGTALEHVPTADIAGKTIHYASIERKALEDLNEQDFLKGAIVDVGTATVTRQIAYDNQGIVPVEQTTNATLDLATGFYWEIRDNANATLFRITENSGTSASTVQVSTDTDVFDVNAATNDFNAGITVRSGGTRPITVGVTDGEVKTTAGDLMMRGFAQLAVSDQWQAGSTYGTDLVLSDASAEWSQFETDFGEVSILNALHQAYLHGSRKPKVYANVTTTINAGTDAGGVGGGANLDAQLPNMSTGTFLTDYDVFVNGELMRPAAGAGVNDYYPGTSLANGQLKFDFKLKTNDVLCVIPYNA